MSSAAANHSFAGTLRQHGLRLAVIALGIGLLLAFVDRFTKTRIEQHSHQSLRHSLDEVLPTRLHDNDLLADSFPLDVDNEAFQQTQLLGLSGQHTGYRATLGGTSTGVILPLQVQGYGGTILLRMGIAADGGVIGVQVLQHQETAGLGSQIDSSQSQWLAGFNQHSLNDTTETRWHVKKDGGDFDQFVGATVTPRAVVLAVHNALLFFEANKNSLLAIAQQQASL